eukprot:3245946-Amphidinium_carterae.1
MLEDIKTEKVAITDAHYIDFVYMYKDLDQRMQKNYEIETYSDYFDSILRNRSLSYSAKTTKTNSKNRWSRRR